MERPENSNSIENSLGSTESLTDEDMTTVRVDRRSFLSRTVLAGSIGVAAAMTAGCPAGSDGVDSDGDSAAPPAEEAPAESAAEEAPAEEAPAEEGSEEAGSGGESQ